MIAADIPLENLLLDPNNYRLQEISGFALIPEDRFHLEQVQKATLQRLQKEGLRELRGSILSNGFLPIERIVVTEYASAAGKYLVIEGNRRVAALMSIKEQADGGIEIPEEVRATLAAVPCVIASDERQFPYFKQTLMGIRHVGGIRPWGGYQRAKLIADLKDIHGVESPDIADRLGLSVQEVNRRYRALKVLQQMENSDEFGEYATPAMYPLFHEAVSLPVVREWLSWNPATNAFENEAETENFYRLITPRTLDDGATQLEPKISSYSEVRELKNVIGNAEARQYLLDPERKFIDALAIARKEEFSKKWRSEVTEAKVALSKIGAIELATLNPADLSLIVELREIADQIIKIRASLANIDPIGAPTPEGPQDRPAEAPNDFENDEAIEIEG